MKFKVLFFNVLVFATCALSPPHCLGQKQVTLSSPDGQLKLICRPEAGEYELYANGEKIMAPSSLGVQRSDEDFSKNLHLVQIGKVDSVYQRYYMNNAKKADIIYRALRRVIKLETAGGRQMEIIFQLSNDGLAFRYVFPGHSNDTKEITSEATSFHFMPGTRAWIQPKAEAGTGFEHTNPSYESYYQMNAPLDSLNASPNGWVYPALFKTGRHWILLTEADLGRTYAATALEQSDRPMELKIRFPETLEKIPGDALNSSSALPWKTSWRIIAIGSLKTLAESTLGTDLAAARVLRDTGYIQPGQASWSWILKKDQGTIYPVQKQYIDFAASMHWKYCLIDAGWDKTIGYDSVAMLADYGKLKNVGLLLWYNSAGNWNTVPFTPKGKLLTHASRTAEFSRLQQMGIKGIKVDFFGGDGQSMINYYRDILDDAARYHLLVNFHGATLPRGLQRTYPNLMTTEAVLGYEMSTFSQQSTDQAPRHMIMSLFARNVFDPMDITPMNLYEIPHIHRATTAAFELATSVACLSGIQHFAVSPEGMRHVPGFVQKFLQHLPAMWQDVHFIDGYPGKYYIVARKSANGWYVAGLNASGESKILHLKLDLSFLKGRTGKLISCQDPQRPNSFKQQDVTVDQNGQLGISLNNNDGFVAVFQ